MNIILFEEKPAGGFIPYSDDRAKHMKKILKVTVGDEVQMGLIGRKVGMAVVTGISDDGITIDWDPQDDPKPLLPIELVVAQVRPICMKRILREAVSLGVRKIHVVGADTAEKSYAKAHLWTKGEYRKFLLHGAEQSVSTLIPECRTYSRIDSLELEHIPTRLLLDNIAPVGDIMEVGITSTVAVAIGPERGWTDREREVFQKMGFSVVGMGERILRTETACSSALGIISGRLRTGR